MLDYNAVIDGMQDVVESGTARIAKIPGIDICAKTGTAEKFTFLDGRKLNCRIIRCLFLLRQKKIQKLLLAVVVENAGFGATWAGPIARILMEKYLNDTIQEKSKADVERISRTEYNAEVL